MDTILSCYYKMNIKESYTYQQIFHQFNNYLYLNKPFIK